VERKGGEEGKGRKGGRMGGERKDMDVLLQIPEYATGLERWLSHTACLSNFQSQRGLT